TLDDIARAVAAPVGGEPARWNEGVARAIRRAGVLIVLELGGDPRAPQTIAALVRAGGERPVIAIADRTPAARAGLIVHAVPALEIDGVSALARQMIGREPPRAWASALHVACRGLAQTAIELLRSIEDVADPFGIDWAARTSSGATDLRARQLE